MEIDMLKEKIEMAISDITKILPEDVNILKDDLEKNVRATLNATFSKMELVTREEFDIQASLLSRTRVKLEELQKKLSELEKEIERNNS
jgi:BMFP domain-containing protein YqiC